MAEASFGGMEMWCGRLSFSPFMERRNCEWLAAGGVSEVAATGWGAPSCWRRASRNETAS